MGICTYSVSELIAHEAPMILIDRIEYFDDENIQSAISIKQSSPFLFENAVPAYIGVEYMAQTVACFSGIKALQSSNAVRIGYLVSVRKLKLFTNAYTIGSSLVAKSCVLYDDGEMAAFECQILHENQLLAEAVLNVYQPLTIDETNTDGLGLVV